MQQVTPHLASQSRLGTATSWREVRDAATPHQLLSVPHVCEATAWPRPKFPFPVFLLMVVVSQISSLNHLKVGWRGLGVCWGRAILWLYQYWGFGEEVGSHHEEEELSSAPGHHAYVSEGNENKQTSCLPPRAVISHLGPSPPPAKTSPGSLGQGCVNRCRNPAPPMAQSCTRFQGLPKLPSKPQCLRDRRWFGMGCKGKAKSLP